MTTNEGFAIYSKILTRTRAIELDKLKRANSVLRAQIALIQFWKYHHANFTLKDGVIIVS